MKTSTKPLSRWKTIGFCSLIFLFSPAGWGAFGALQMAPLPRELSWFFQIHRTFFIFGMFVALVTLISLPIIIINDVSVRFLPRFRHRQSFTGNWPRSVQISFLLAALSFLFFRPIFDLRFRGLPNISRNAQPVIVAIEKYRRQNKQYPDSLNELIPKYISAIPYTGAVGFPDYEYRRMEADENLRKESYELFVRTPEDGFTPNRFLYSPHRKRTKQSENSMFEPVGDWFYYRT